MVLFDSLIPCFGMTREASIYAAFRVFACTKKWSGGHEVVTR